MMNPKMPGAPMPKPKSSPNILEWLLVILSLVTIAGVGYLYLTLTQLNDSVTSAKADVMSVKTELMAQKQAMVEKEVMAMQQEEVMEGSSMAGWTTYASPEYTFQYPPTYTVEPATDSYRVLKLRGERGRIELWKFSDLPDRAIDFGDTNPTPEQLNASLPQQEWDVRTSDVENGKIFNYVLWLFYTDDETRDELQHIANTIR